MNGCQMLVLLFADLLLYKVVRGKPPHLTIPGQLCGPRYLQFFAQGCMPPTNTIIVSEGSNGEEKFGLIRSVSNVLREGASPKLKEIESQISIVVVGKDRKDVYNSFTYFLNENATHHGTIAIHGHNNGTAIVDRVFAMVGGTHDFFGIHEERSNCYRL